MEKQLELAVGERNTTEQRARALTDELTKAEAAATAAQARIAELQKALADHQAADEARRARDAEIQSQLSERNQTDPGAARQLPAASLKRSWPPATTISRPGLRPTPRPWRASKRS